MSEMRTYGCIRFKVKEGVILKQIYDSLKSTSFTVVGLQPEYKSNWNGKEFVKTDELEFITTVAQTGCINFITDLEYEKYYIDVVLFDKAQDDGDCLDKSLRLSLLNNLENRVYSDVALSDLVEEGARLIVTDWYTGSDMPIYWD